MNQPKAGDKVLIRHPDGSVTEATMVYVSPEYVTALMRRQQEMFRRSGRPSKEGDKPV